MSTPTNDFVALLPLYQTVTKEEFDRDVKALQLIGLTATVSTQYEDDCFYKEPRTEAELNFFCALYSMGYLIKKTSITSTTIIVRYEKNLRPMVDRDELIQLIKSKSYFINLGNKSLSTLERISSITQLINEPLKTIATLLFMVTVIAILLSVTNLN